MSWVSRIFGNSTGGIISSGTKAYEAVAGNKAESNKYAHQADMASTMAYSPQFIAPPYIPPGAGWFYSLLMWSLWMIRMVFDVIVWGARPMIFLCIFYVFFWWPYKDPTGYVVYMKAIGITPPAYMNFALGALGGFLGIRTIIKDSLSILNKKGFTAPTLDQAKEVIELKKSIEDEAINDSVSTGNETIDAFNDSKIAPRL